MAEERNWEEQNQETYSENQPAQYPEDPQVKKKGTSNRGFASMNAETQRSIASKGGKAAHRQGVAHEWSSDEARAAGRKGGEIVSQDRNHMAEIGRKGGEARGSKKSDPTL
jgi:general stress protein YciG